LQGPIKTLHLTNAYHHTSGGISTHYRAMLDEANRQHRHMRLIVPGQTGGVQDVGAYGRIYSIASPNSPFFDSSYRLIFPSRYLLPPTSDLIPILQEEQPDLIEICDKYTLIWLAGLIRKHLVRKLARPVLVGLSCERMDINVSAYLSRSSLMKRFSDFYMRSIYVPIFDFHLANSRYTAEELLLAAGEAKADKVRVFQHGVDSEQFNPGRRSQATRMRLFGHLSLTPGTCILLYTGRLAREKNVALLIDVIQELAADESRDYRLVIAGSGPLSDWLKQEGDRRAPGRVHMFGYVAQRDQLADLYSNCDAFLHPNPREPFGLAPLEAMASGCPVVLPRAGGVLSYADDSNSWLAEPNQASFSAAVSSVFSNPEVSAEKIRRGCLTARNRSLSIMSARMFEMYDEIYTSLKAELAAKHPHPHPQPHPSHRDAAERAQAIDNASTSVRYGEHSPYSEL
jgi:alpha-1,6-mannosyltransferase